MISLTTDLPNNPGEADHVPDATQMNDEYREPCVFDLNNGPVLVEVRDSHDRPWQTATLTGVGHPSARYRFSTEDNEDGCFSLGRWKQARIKRACSDQAPQMPQPPQGWRLLGKNEVLRKGDKRFNVHGKAWDLERRHIGDLVSDSFSTRFIRRNTFAIGERVVVVGVPGYSQRIYRALENSKITPPKPLGMVSVVCETSRNRYEFCTDMLAPYFEDSK